MSRARFEQGLQGQLIGGVVDVAAGVALFFGARRLTELTNTGLLSTDDHRDPNEEQADDDNSTP